MSTIARYETKIEDKPWGKLALVAEMPASTCKVLVRYGAEPYHRAGLQYHPDRDETAHLLSGEAWLYFVDRDNVLKKTHLTQGMSVHIPAHVVHSFETIGDSLVVELSMPSTTPAVRVEDDYDVTAAVEVEPSALEVYR